MIVTKEEVQRIYRRRFSEEDKKAKSAVWKVIVESFFQRWVKPTDTVLDLGCGYGEFLNYLRCSRRIGVDLNADSQIHLAPGVEFHQQSVCDLSFLPDNSVDVVFTSNLMEHLPSKREVEQMAREALRVLRPGGHFIMMGPNLRLLPGTYWDFWDHVVPITDRSLVECLENLQYEIADCYARFLPYTTRSALPQAPWLVRVYLSMPWAWRILGKQFLIRARKPIPKNELVSVVVPVYNESQNIAPCVKGLENALRDMPHEILVCYDFDEDTTLPALAAMPDRPASIRLVKNSLGRGVAFALQAGFNAAQGDVVVSTMADLSDPPSAIPLMAAKVRDGADVVSGSRYMKGGAQHGGPFLKRTLSRIAGLSLRYVAGMGTHDATTNFRAYSSKFLCSHSIESTAGFEVALELTTKAHLEGARVDEVPSTWHDRTAGESRFNLKKWLPKYLQWYGKAMAQPLVVWSVFIAALVGWLVLIHKFAAKWPFWDELFYLKYTVGAQPITWAMLWVDHNGHRILIPKIIYFTLMRAFHYQPTAVMFFSLISLALGALCLLLAIRKTRGHMSWIDLSVVAVVLAFSQYENLLWAFQLPFTLAGTLLVLIIAAAVATRDNLDRRTIFLFGAIAIVLPYFGGPGMCTAPGIILWLLGIGVIYFLRARDRNDRIFAAYSLTFGILAGLAWALAIHGLPPSPAPQILLDSFRSRAGFHSFVSAFYEFTREFLSAFFLPDSVNASIPLIYRSRIWGEAGLALFLSSAVVLVVSWFRLPRERLRISALSACHVAFLFLLLLLYLARGMYGAGSGAVARYSTVAMPLLLISIVSFCIYAPRLLRVAVPAMVVAAMLFLLGGSHGNIQKMQAFSKMERDAYSAFDSEIHRPGGSSIEELAAHFNHPLYGPGDASQVPGFIQLMADNHIGPFRRTNLIPFHISSWSASPLPLHSSLPSAGLHLDGMHASKDEKALGYLTLSMDQPLPLSAIRLTFRTKASPGFNACIALTWYLAAEAPPDLNFSKQYRSAISSDSNVKTVTFQVFSKVDRICVLLSAGISDWEFIKAEKLDPVTATASTVPTLQ